MNVPSELRGLREHPIQEHLRGVRVRAATDKLQAAEAERELAEWLQALHVEAEPLPLEVQQLVVGDPDANGIAAANHPLRELAIVAGDHDILLGEQVAYVVLAERHEQCGERA